MLRYWKQRLDDKELQFPSGRPSVPSAGGGEETGLCLLSQAPPQAGMQRVNDPPVPALGAEAGSGDVCSDCCWFHSLCHGAVPWSLAERLQLVVFGWIHGPACGDFCLICACRVSDHSTT